MTTSTDPEPDRRETALKTSLRAALQAGIAAARDPINAGLPDLAVRTTTIYSPWFKGVCPECKLRFREGDRVRLCPGCDQAYHDDDQYGLHCWTAHFAGGAVCRVGRQDRITDVWIPGCDYRWPGTFPGEAEAGAGTDPATRRVAQVATQFERGLKTMWQSFGDQAVIQVAADSELVGRECPWCRFKIRPGDRVVRCPCGHCNTYLHDDLFRHLTCWNEWNGSQGKDYCPTTGARIEHRSPSRPPEVEHDG